MRTWTLSIHLWGKWRLSLVCEIYQSSIFHRYAQPNRKYFSRKYEQTKQHNDTWRYPPPMEFIIRIKVTTKAPKKGYMGKIKLQNTKRSLDISEQELIRNTEQKLSIWAESDQWERCNRTSRNLRIKLINNPNEKKKQPQVNWSASNGVKFTRSSS